MRCIRVKICGLILAVSIVVTVPYGVFGAERIATVAGRLGEQQTLTIQQVQPVPPNEALEFREPAANRIYVHPHWADGGHGVQVLVPGYWTDAKQAGKR